MKKILITASFIAGLLFIACANTTSNTSQEQTPTENQQDNQPIPLFTPEEIAYNESIKNLPMDYTIVAEDIQIDLCDPAYKKIWHNGEKIYDKTQEEAYLQAYPWLCSAVKTQVSNRLRFMDGDRSLFVKSTVKLLNKEGKDIIPLIDFPDRKFKEDSVWNESIEFMKRNRGGVIENLDMYVQPIVNKGDTIVLEMNNDLLTNSLK